MKSKRKKKIVFPDGTVLPAPATRPPRLHISKEEFLHRLRNIGEWRKKRLAELHAEIRAKGSR